MNSYDKYQDAIDEVNNCTNALVALAVMNDISGTGGGCHFDESARQGLAIIFHMIADRLVEVADYLDKLNPSFEA